MARWGGRSSSLGSLVRNRGQHSSLGSWWGALGAHPSLGRRCLCSHPQDPAFCHQGSESLWLGALLFHS